MTSIEGDRLGAAHLAPRIAMLVNDTHLFESSTVDYVNSKWPHGDGLIWPRPVVVRA